jgi:Flp pilus assembly CpaE family ATPase
MENTQRYELITTSRTDEDSFLYRAFLESQRGPTIRVVENLRDNPNVVILDMPHRWPWEEQ